MAPSSKRCSNVASTVYAINPKQLDRFRDRFSPAGAKDDSRDAEVLSDAVRTDRRAFRRLALAEPLVIELREWSRMTDDLNGERNRLCNRLREQLWRYFPAMLELEQDLGAEWFLDLWELVPTPDKAMRIRETSIARILKSRRIRRVTAAEVLAVLRKPPVTVARGTIEAASAHIRVLSERLRVAETARRRSRPVGLKAAEMGPDTNANRPPAAGQNINCHGPATAARFLLGELGGRKGGWNFCPPCTGRVPVRGSAPRSGGVSVTQPMTVRSLESAAAPLSGNRPALGRPQLA